MNGLPAAQPETQPAALAVDAEALGRMLTLSTRSIRRLDSAGNLPAPLRIGGAVRWPLDGPGGIRSWLAAGAPDRARFAKIREVTEGPATH